MLVGLKKIRKLSGQSQDEVSSALDIPIGTYRTWEQCRNSPKGKELIKLADYFDVTVDGLLGRGELPANAIRPVVSEPATAPLYGKIAAGQPIEMLEVCELLDLPKSVIDGHPNGFFLEVAGDSMDKIIRSGGYAFIDPDVEVYNDDIVAINVNGFDATLKRFYKTDARIILSPSSLNPEHDDQIYEMDDPDMPNMRIIGKMVWVMYPIDFKY